MDLMSGPNPPQHMTAYMNEVGKWVASIRKSRTGTYSLTRCLRRQTTLRIPFAAQPTEYFVVEYGKKPTTSRTPPGEGLLVMRIKPAATGNATAPGRSLHLRPNGTTAANGLAVERPLQLHVADGDQRSTIPRAS